MSRFQFSFKFLITVSHNSGHSYLDDDTVIPAEEFESRCHEGFQLVHIGDKEKYAESSQNKSVAESSQNKSVEKLKWYLFVSYVVDDRPNEVLLAYKCPTNPPIYIPVPFDKNGNEQIYRILYKKSYPFSTLMRFTEYHMKLAKLIREGKTYSWVELCKFSLKFISFTFQPR